MADGVFVSKSSARFGPCCCQHEHLTDREISVVCAVAAGQTNKQIAKLMNVSEHTVHRHMTAMLRRAGETNRTSLVSRAYFAGILILGERGPERSGRRCLQHWSQAET
jgi:DNA-binding NarL/FixJ family response regulator